MPEEAWDARHKMMPTAKPEMMRHAGVRFIQPSQDESLALGWLPRLAPSEAAMSRFFCASLRRLLPAADASRA